jgi:hypothetical protein
MALSDPKDTLAFHQSRVLTQHRDMSEVPCLLVAKALQKFKNADEHKDTVPEAEALWFYGMNHGMALISAARAPLEPLPPDELNFVEAYHHALAPKAIRAFYYLLWICTREARHNLSLKDDAHKITANFGAPVCDFLTSIKGGEKEIAQAFLSKPPDAPIGTYVKALAWTFYHSKWSSSYGGKKWGAVTDCLVRFVTGEFTAEMMLDTVWTLAHNGGPIFNKAAFYGMYSSSLYRLLDVQRSGQIPEAITTDAELGKFAGPELLLLMQYLKMRFPGKLGEFVDWQMVEALGSVHKYPQDKAQQIKLHGQSPEAKAAAKLASEQTANLAKKQAEAAAAKAADYAQNYFQVMHDVHVKKIKLARAA